MIYEIATIEVREGDEAAFEAAVTQAVEIFRRASGCRSMNLERGIEHPARYRLVVGWDRIEDHMEIFRTSAGFQQWRALVGRYFANAPEVEHVATAIQGF